MFPPVGHSLVAVVAHLQDGCAVTPALKDGVGQPPIHTALASQQRPRQQLEDARVEVGLQPCLVGGADVEVSRLTYVKSRQANQGRGVLGQEIEQG